MDLCACGCGTALTDDVVTIEVDGNRWAFACAPPEIRLGLPRNAPPMSWPKQKAPDPPVSSSTEAIRKMRRRR